MNITDKTLKEVLVKEGFISEKDFDNAAQSAADLGKNIADILVFRGFVDEETLGKLLSKHLNVPYANLKRVTIPEEILNLIPEKMARTYRVVPLELEGEKLKLAMQNPEDFEALEFTKRQTGMPIIPYYARGDDISKALGQYKKNIKSDFGKIIEENLKEVKDGGDDLEKAAEKLPVIKILDTILEYAVAERASDIHIETMEDQVIIRFRVDGVLRDIVKLPRGIEVAVVARIKILSNLKIDEHRIPQDGRYKIQVDEEIVAFRISIIPGFHGENVVMRLLHETNRPLSLEELGIVGSGLEIIRQNITKPHGMILVTGPTGSGKTTTLYSVLNILNTTEVKICTIEDPIEYGVNRVSQIQVNQKAGLEFSAGLRALLRHDPDIIMVGEIRDEETAEIAIHAALTGHLVLSTLHTNTAAGAVPRFLDMGVEDFLLASTLNVVIAQRLARKICSQCITKYQPDDAVKKRIEKRLGAALASQQFYKGQGCDACHGKGYTGRIGLYEVMPISEKLRDLITKESSADVLAKQAVVDGMVTMLQDGMDKVSSGMTTIEEVLRIVQED